MENALGIGTIRKHLGILKEHGEAFLLEYEELCKKHSMLIDSFAGDPEIVVADRSGEIVDSLKILRKSLKMTMELCVSNLECGGKTPVETTIH